MIHSISAALTVVHTGPRPTGPGRPVAVELAKPVEQDPRPAHALPGRRVYQPQWDRYPH